MSDTFPIPTSPAQFELVEQRSRFIAEAMKVGSREEVGVQLDRLRRLHPKANHVCYGFIAGVPGDAQNWGFSDDGEPNGTAGKPILNILQHSGLGQVMVAVVRYFGGVKLGTGGLVHAYGAAAKGVLEILPTEVFEQKTTVQLQCSFSHESKLRRILSQLHVDIAHCKYGEEVSVVVDISEVQMAKIEPIAAEGWFCLEIENS